MSRSPSRAARAGARGVASSPAVAGFRPAVVAMAAALAIQAHAQTAVHGTATVHQDGNRTTVTTTNGAGHRSVINWQHFGVAAGATTHFAQPDALSTSINRVNGGTRSDILGTLSSNGRLVLVNPSGLAFGANSFVDTAGFTASALGLSEADAIAGRLLFQGGSNKIIVEGGEKGGARILANGGDIVLVGSQVQVQRNAVLQSNGATILAAGEKVEITGRGLEGIRMEMQAGNEALNLGTLRGDAVGIFANTLKHSGIIQANALTTEGGRVVLKAVGGDALVDGSVTARGNGGKGGAIDVLGQRVGLLAGATLDASGASGGGTIRVGGDYQGKNADVMNAQRTYVDAQASLRADALENGNGGRIIVWADEVTRMQGRISARGGAQGGDGGFAEVSGKQHLEFTGRADLRAPNGRAGTLLLDPNDIRIVQTGSTTTTSPSPGSVFSGGDGTSTVTEAAIEEQLALSSVIVLTNAGTGGNGDITVEAGVSIDWDNANAFALQADRNIILDGSIRGTNADSALSLLAGTATSPTATGTVTQAAGSVVQVGNLLVNSKGDVDMQGSNLVGTVSANTGNGNFHFHNAQSLGIGHVTTAYGGSYYGINAGTGLVDITAAGDITLKLPPAPAPTTAPATQSIIGSSVRLEAAGSIELYGDIEATGTTTLIAQGGNVVQQNGFVEGRGGITILAEQGSVYFTALYAGGAESTGTSGQQDGANITIVAKGDVDGGEIDASGGLYDDGESTPVGGNGGIIDVTSKQGNITIEDARASGGSSGAGAGGSGGKVKLKALALDGGVHDVMVGELDVSGGDGTTAGNGGEAHLTADGGSVLAVGIGANGGNANGEVAGAAGGDGGLIRITAKNEIGIVAPDGPGEFRANGGDSEAGAGGNGGKIELTAGGRIGGVAPQLETPTFAAAPAITYAPTTGYLEAVGGTGGQDSMGNGLTGGNGGRVILTRTGSADLRLDAGLDIDVSGGQGGYADTEIGTAGGQGGAGGEIKAFATPPTRIVLADARIMANGGLGGLNPNESRAASGALGTFRAEAGSVDIEGNVTSATFAANWVNDSIVRIGGSSVFTGMGAFQNNSDLVLSGSARFLMSDGVRNAGRLATTSGADALADIRENTGTIDVVAGSTLGAPYLEANQGVLHVDGTFDTGASGTFNNQASGKLAGNGTIRVGGGSGTLNNGGTISPGNSIGTLTIDGNLVMEAGSVYAAEILNATDHDRLVVTGTVTAGGSIAVSYLQGASFAAGDTFRIIQAGSVSSASSVPTDNKSEVDAQLGATEVRLVASAALVAAPAVAPPDEVAAAQESNNALTAFLQLYQQELERQQQEEKDENRIGKDDIVVTDTACAR